MSMLDATTLLKNHPAGYEVYDAYGRHLNLVFACNPETGEAVMYGHVPNTFNWIVDRLYKAQILRSYTWLFRIGVPRRHGFWPAPLTLVPNKVDA